MLLAPLVLASLLQIPADLIAQQMLDSMNSQVESHAYRYQNEVVRFNHQFWMVDSRSVCFDNTQDASRHSLCTQKAKALFNELCQAMKDKQHKNMYCHAAARYQPQVAQIKDYGKSRRAELKRRCGDLRVQAMADKTLVAERDRVCGEYERE